MVNLPEWIYFNGGLYYFKEWQSDDEILKNWWFCGYWPNKDINQMPAETTDGHGRYFLVSADIDKKLAKKDLLKRINDMKPWL